MGAAATSPDGTPARAERPCLRYGLRGVQSVQRPPIQRDRIVSRREASPTTREPSFRHVRLPGRQGKLPFAGGSFPDDSGTFLPPCLPSREAGEASFCGGKLPRRLGNLPSAMSAFPGGKGSFLLRREASPTAREPSLPPCPPSREARGKIDHFQTPPEPDPPQPRNPVVHSGSQPRSRHEIRSSPIRQPHQGGRPPPTSGRATPTYRQVRGPADRIVRLLCERERPRVQRHRSDRRVPAPIGLKFMEMVEYLEALLGRKIDVLTPVGLRGIRLPEVARQIEESVVHV